ncbi:MULTISPECIES: SMP-30/gluconolactonase/LRE family protein [Haloferax]|uniref:SMP-30/Gluconolactonase/LRE-like region domain-containing protein n=2 Tax=Haloferax TaxID=2251 RepID=A0A6G1Z514_9EURY|nr:MULTISPECIES: SMP-30/gluconolactonase/LRE family protein [Haloferax]KAB1188917.1 hypothetical protein Hfx1149_13095 [Haloferax sp. CBA1149]MRW81640.1 hypothetical protein [Haloferax marinisediminis]
MTLFTSRRTMLKALGVGGMTLAAGCLAASEPTTAATQVQSDDTAVGQLELLYEFARPTPQMTFPGELPENVAIDASGNKYVSIASLGHVWKFGPDNELEQPNAAEGVPPFAVFPVSGTFLVGTIGLEVDADGTVYVCFASDFDKLEEDPGESATNGIWTVKEGEAPELFAEITPLAAGALTFPNDLVLFDDSLLVTDSLSGVVWQVRKDEATVWSDSPLLAGGEDFGADGIQVSRDGATVYVTNIARGSIVAIPVNEDGTAGEASVFVDGLAGPDGLAMDVDGNLYVADNRGNQIVRVSPDANVEVLAQNDGQDDEDTDDDGEQEQNGDQDQDRDRDGDQDGEQDQDRDRDQDCVTEDGAPVLDSPADVTFGTTEGEETSVFIVNLAFSADPKPSLMKLDVGIQGFPATE